MKTPAMSGMPGLFYGGCHGSNEQEVFAELCQIVEETIALIHQDGKPLPPRPPGRELRKKSRHDTT